MGFESLLASLNTHKADYVVIGAVCLPVHGYYRATADLDILFRPTLENARRVRLAMEAVRYDLQGLPDEQMLETKLLFRGYASQVDLHPFVKGVDFDRVWRNRVTGTYEQTPASFASLDDLIAIKEAAGRPKDLEDLKALRKLKQRQERAGASDEPAGQ